MHTIHKKIGAVLLVSFALLIVISLPSRVPSARAGFFDSVLNFLKGSTSSIPQNEAPKKAPEVSLYKPAIDYEQAVVAAVDKASPSVVSIVISKDVPVIEQCPYSPFQNLPPEFQDFFGGASFTQPCEKGTKKQDVGGGSGFIVSSDGLIVTNKHVAGDEKASYTVFTNDGKKYSAKVIAVDPSQDLAVIKIDGSGFIPATLGDSDSVKLGQTAIAIGNALGEYRNTVSVGVISGLSRNITASGAGFGAEAIQGVIQTDAAINPGNSGGPLLNLKGEVIAINTAVASGAQNIGFAIPINQARRDINSVKQTGSIKVPYLGVRYILVDEEVAKKQNLSSTSGALVRGTEDGPGVIAGSPAEKAGIVAEDIITKIDGHPISKDVPLSSLLTRYAVGDTIEITAIRGKETMNFTVKLTERPKGL